MNVSYGKPLEGQHLQDASQSRPNTCKRIPCVLDFIPIGATKDKEHGTNRGRKEKE